MFSKLTNSSCPPVSYTHLDVYKRQTQLYAAGQLSLGGVVAGLCTGAGVGLAVLLRANKNAKQNLFIVALLYGIGVAAGLVCSLFA